MLLEGWRQNLFYFVFDLLPDFNSLSVFFLFGQKSFLKLADYFFDFFSSAGDNIGLALRHDYVINTPGDAGLGNILIAEIFYLVENFRSLIDAIMHDKLVDERGYSLGIDLFIDKREVIRQNAVEK